MLKKLVFIISDKCKIQSDFMKNDDWPAEVMTMPSDEAGTDFDKMISDMIHSTGSEPGNMLLVSDIPGALTEAEKRDIAAAAWQHEANENEGFPGIIYVIREPAELSFGDYDHIYRRLRGLPCDILTTERFLVREMTVEDVDAMYELYRPESITRYTDTLFADPGEERSYTAAYIKTVYGYYDFGMWLVFDKASGELVGRAGAEYGEQGLDMGCIIAKHRQRQGCAFEVCSAIMDYMRDNFGYTEFHARIHRDNEASLALFKKLGFERMNFDICDNTEYNIYRYSDIRS